MEVYNFELYFSENVFQNGCISLSFLAACRITLAIFPDSLRATYFPGTTPSQFFLSICDKIVSLVVKSTIINTKIVVVNDNVIPTTVVRNYWHNYEKRYCFGSHKTVW